jgi:hypothetical protein
MLRIFSSLRHGRWAESVSASLDGELAYGEAVGLERHLARCERCRALQRDLRAVKAAVHRLPFQQPTRSFQLTPAMVAARRAEPLVMAAARPAYGLRFAGASAVVALLAFFVTVGLDLAGGDAASGGRSRTSAGEAAPAFAPAGGANTMDSTSKSVPAAATTAPTTVPRYNGGGADAQGVGAPASPTSAPFLYGQTEPAGAPPAAQPIGAAPPADTFGPPAPAASDSVGRIRVIEVALLSGVAMLGAATLILWKRRRKLA